MRCIRCTYENRDGRLFCSECGARLHAVCLSCAADVEAGDKFCGECGAALVESSPAPSLERVSTPLPESLAAGRYSIEELVGEGARKKVYRARDTRLDRDVAVALIKAEGLDDAGRTRVRREAQAMAQLGDHAHIVTVHDIGEESGRLYIVSQLMGGGDLAVQLADAENGRLALEDSLRIAQQVCQALEYAHSRGIVHRDLKPGNVWMTSDGTAKLGDFGLAVSLDRSRLTEEGIVLGTALYMPPEQAVGRSADARSDLYALGAMLYELVTGRPPFLGDDAVAIISQHINTPPVAPSWHNAEVPKPLERLILWLLEKDPDARPADAGEVAAALAAIDLAPVEDAGAQSRSDVNPLDRLAAGVFVGRDREVQQLRVGVDDAIAARGRILLLVGEPGIGKTRTSEELATYAQMRGAQVLWGRCYEGEGAPDYWPWVQILRDYVHRREPDALRSEMGPGAADIAEVVSDVRERLPDLPKPPKLEPEEARFRLFDSITTFLRNASAGTPLVLILDDLHWADKPSLLLFQFLARDLGQIRLLVLGTYRDVELGRQHPLEQTLAELARSQLCERVLLRGLTESDVARFIELSAGRAPHPTLVEAVYRETEGNPFFVHEVVRLLQGDGRLERMDEIESWSVEIPQGVRQVIGRRLSSLSDEGNQILAIASVVGREFELRVLASVAEEEEDAVLERLEEAEDARIIGEIEGRPGTYRFSHALVRETLYDELRTTRRLRLHRRVGEVLEALYGEDPDSHLAELAYHFCEAASGGDVDKAIDYAERAAIRSSRLLAYEEAANHYDRALSALEARDPVDEGRRCQLLVALGEARLAFGATIQALDAFRRSLAKARDLGDSELFARGALGLGVSQFSSASRTDEELVEVLDEALLLLGEADSALRVRLLARLSAELMWAGQPERRESLVQEAVDVARRLGDREALAAALFQAVYVLEPENLEARLVLADEMVELAREADLKRSEFYGRVARIGFLVQLGDAAAIEREQESLQRVAEELRQPLQLGFATRALAAKALWEGRLAEARDLSWEGLNLVRRVDDESARQIFGIQLYDRRRKQGRLAELEAALLDGVERFPSGMMWSCLLACMYAETGQPEKVRPVLDRLNEDGFVSPGTDINFLENLCLLADACLVLGDPQHAKTLYVRLLPHAGRFANVIAALNLGSIDRCLGNLAGVLGRFEEAAAHFRVAIDGERRLGADGLLPRTQADYARLLLDHAEPGDRKQALALLDEALETSGNLGLDGFTSMAVELKLRAQGAEPSSIVPTLDM